MFIWISLDLYHSIQMATPIATAMIDQNFRNGRGPASQRDITLRLWLGLLSPLGCLALELLQFSTTKQRHRAV
ncbi:hypothetical protein TNCV_1410821 [Trichonephila clavipes]|nr:hypothetical protein TNCV_1410821 [Trichonephila clavipes]